MAVTAQQELVLTEQFRPAVQANVIDLPRRAGGDIEGAEAEELAEAAGARTRRGDRVYGPALQRLFRCPSSPGLSSEIVDYFIGYGARGPRRAGTATRRSSRMPFRWRSFGNGSVAGRPRKRP